jgi:hypothetical protein
MPRLDGHRDGNGRSLVVDAHVAIEGSGDRGVIEDIRLDGGYRHCALVSLYGGNQLRYVEMHKLTRIADPEAL